MRYRQWQKVDRRYRAGQQRPRQRNEHVTASRRDVTRCDTRASDPSSVRITCTSVDARRIHPQRIRNDRVSHMSRVSRAA